MHDKELALNLLKTLSALEALVLSCGKSLPSIAPDYLLVDIEANINELRKIILEVE